VFIIFLLCKQDFVHVFIKLLNSILFIIGFFSERHISLQRPSPLVWVKRLPSGSNPIILMTNATNTFTWSRFPIKNLLIDFLLTPIMESTYLNVTNLYFLADLFAMFYNVNSTAAKNFVREGPVNDIVSHWRRLKSDCSFRFILAVENWCKAPAKMLASLFWGGMASSAAALLT